MRIKLTIIAIITAVFIAPSFADNAKTTTSKGYVDTQIATKQDKVPAVDTNTVITTTNTTGEIGQKSIYDASGNYATQTDALVTAADANAAVQNAIDTEFVCVEWAPNTTETPENCYIWQIRAAHTATLPSAYTALEYLESTGTQYIDTGIKVQADTLAEFEYQFTGTNSSSNYVFGQVAGVGACCFGYRYGNGIWWFQRNTFANIYDSLKHRVVYGIDGNAYRDDLLFARRGEYGCNRTPQNYTIVIFAERNDPQYGEINKGWVKIYYFILKEGNNTVRNFIPARRNSDGELGMYDLVSNQFFTNAGSGTFVAGPVASYIPQNQ